jgi:hypothetical protein
MPGFNTFLFSQQNLNRNTTMSATIFGTSKVVDALLYNYLADKKIRHPSHIISDDIPIAYPICPQPIEETCPPTPIEEPIIPPFYTPHILPYNSAIMKSHTSLAFASAPALILKKEPEIIPPVSPTISPDPSIQKTHIQLANPICPIKIIYSRARL